MKATFNRLLPLSRDVVLNNYIAVIISLVFGCYLIILLKVSYNREREKLQEANVLLQQKTDEIRAQNEQLLASGEILDSHNIKLEHQRKELVKIKATLEGKVNERTSDLRKVNEKLIFQNQQLEQYAFITSHNLRAPIAQIKGLVRLLPLQKKFDPLTNETLQRLGDSSEKLVQVVSDLGTILQIKKSMQQVWEDVDIKKELKSIILSLQELIKEKQINVILPVSFELVIKSIRTYSYSILHNVIENALKYSDPKKDSLIKIELGESTKFHKVSITDNGIGMDMALASDKIFQMYQRFNNTHPGQGFGLYLVKSQIEAMDGKVEFESVLGQGTTFNLYFSKR